MNRKAWIEAMRPRTLPVSVAGVIAGCSVAVFYGSFRWLPALICLLFALGAQIVSNFANEYYDFRNGLDKKGREGFRRGVTEGDLTPGTMKRATFGLLAVTCLVGCTLIWWGGFWLVGAGVLIALGALAYSTGPWPLSHHGLGDVAVILFYGIVPVMLTAYVQCGADWNLSNPTGAPQPLWLNSLIIGIGTGLIADTILIVNNYRDMEDDMAVGKRTTVVLLGRKATAYVYMGFWLIGDILLSFPLTQGPKIWATCGWAALICLQSDLFRRLRSRSGAAQNKTLKSTAQTMLLTMLWLLITTIF